MRWFLVVTMVTGPWGLCTALARGEPQPQSKAESEKTEPKKPAPKKAESKSTGTIERMVVKERKASGEARGAERASWSAMGGQLFRLSENALSFGAGYPNALDVSYRLPMERRFEMSPTFRLFYARAINAPRVGLLVTDMLKFSVYESGRFHLSVGADPGIGFNFYPGKFGFILSIGLPQVLATYWAQPKLALHFGFKMPILLQIRPGFVAVIPLLASVGFEYRMAANWNIFAVMDMGADVYAAKEGTNADFYPGFSMGAAYRF